MVYFIIIGALALVGGIYVFYLAHREPLGAMMTVVGLIMFACAVICASSISPRNANIDYTPVTVIINGESYSGKWYPDEQEEFIVYKDDDFTKCVVGRIYNVGYGPWDEGD